MDATSGLTSALAELALEAEPVGPGAWRLPLPSEARGRFSVGIACGERTVTLSTFFMRAPDRDAAGVHRRLLRRNLDMAEWRFAIDDHGDLFMVAQLPAAELCAARLDDLLGLLVTYVDELYEPVVRQGFDIPPGVSVAGPPPASRPGA